MAKARYRCGEFGLITNKFQRICVSKCPPISTSHPSRRSWSTPKAREPRIRVHRMWNLSPPLQIHGQPFVCAKILALLRGFAIFQNIATSILLGRVAFAHQVDLRIALRTTYSGTSPSSNNLSRWSPAKFHQDYENSKPRSERFGDIISANDPLRVHVQHLVTKVLRPCFRSQLPALLKHSDRNSQFCLIRKFSQL